MSEEWTMAFRRKLTGIAAAALLLGGAGVAQLAAAGPAAAEPACRTGWTSETGQVACSDIERYQVVISCAHAGVPYWVYGEEAGPGGISQAVCHPGDLLSNQADPSQSVGWNEF
jgi:hypothetical protein